MYTEIKRKNAEKEMNDKLTSDLYSIIYCLKFNISTIENGILAAVHCQCFQRAAPCRWIFIIKYLQGTDTEKQHQCTM